MMLTPESRFGSAGGKSGITELSIVIVNPRYLVVKVRRSGRSFSTNYAFSGHEDNLVLNNLCFYFGTCI
jgi:hypothetical protein